MTYIIKNNNRIVEEVKSLDGLTLMETILVKLIANDGNYVEFGNKISNDSVFALLQEILEGEGWKFDKELAISCAALVFVKNNHKFMLGFDNVLHYNPKPVFSVTLNK